jgi:hypothetical protein
MVEMVHIYNAHPNKSCKQTKPALSFWPLMFKSQDAMSLLVMLINEGQVVIEQMYNPGAWYFFAGYITKIIIKIGGVN